MSNIRDIEESPRLVLFQLLTGHYISHALYVAAKLGLADQLAGGPKDAEELAVATATHAPSLRRVMRLLAAAGVLSEADDGRFALTPVGDYLRSEAPLSARATALLFAGPNMGAWRELLYSVQTGDKSFERVYGCEPFAYMSQHPEDAKVFNEAMTSASAQVARAVPKAYDFSRFRTVADVGGGHGVLLASILNAYPQLHGILFEVPHVAEGANKYLESAGVAGRCRIVGGDFFADVPAGADCYLLKSVIHDWDDERSVAILRNCHKAMPADGRLLLVEMVLPTRARPGMRERIVLGSDVNMLVNVGGRERSEADFAGLYRAADFRLERVWPIEGSLSSVLEGTKA